MLRKLYVKELDKSTDYNEHIDIWKKIVRRLKSHKTLEKLIKDSEHYYFNPSGNQKFEESGIPDRDCTQK